MMLSSSLELTEAENLVLKRIVDVFRSSKDLKEMPIVDQMKLFSRLGKHFLAQQLAFLSLASRADNIKDSLTELTALTRMYEAKLRKLTHEQSHRTNQTAGTC